MKFSRGTTSRSEIAGPADFETESEIVLQELYIDNYKSLVNCHYKPAAMQLLLGENGSGKTSVFDVLDNLRRIITRGGHVADWFPMSTLTAWSQRPVQLIELQLSGNGGTYGYRIEIEHDRKLAKNRIKYESLMFVGQLLYELSHLFCSRVRQELDPEANAEDGLRLSLEQVRSAMNTWLESADLKPAARKARYEKELKKQQYYQDRNRQARVSHTKTRKKELAKLDIDPETIKSCCR